MKGEFIKYMRYSIISDVHGNLNALNAVLEDCENQDIDKYLFLGDYYGEFPLHNEVILRIKEIDEVDAIKGNKEARMVKYKKIDSKEWISEQFAPLYWNLKKIKDNHYTYIESLPEKLFFTVNNINYYMAHSPNQHFGYGIVDNICGRTFLNQFGKEYSNHAEYLTYVKSTLQENQEFIKKLSKIPDGVYLFGHYHTQWHANINNKLLINPGSCGLPLDFNTSAPYTILDTNNLSVIERRVQYNTKIPVQLLKESDFYNVAPFWNELSISEFENARVTVLLFLEFVEELAAKRNDKRRPYSNELWLEAISLYKNKTHLS